MRVSAIIGRLIDAVMLNTKFCLLSLLLIVMAIGAHGVALSNWSRSSGIRAQAVSMQQELRLAMRAKADRFGHRGAIFSGVGLIFAVAGATSLVGSFHRHEPAPWRPIPVALLVLYVVFQFFMV